MNQSIESHYISALLSYVDNKIKEGVSVTALDVWNALSEADPDKQKHSYARWILDHAIVAPHISLDLEDFRDGKDSRVHRVLQRFMEVKNILPDGKWSIHGFQNLDDIETVLDNLEKTDSHNAFITNDALERIEDKTAILYNRHDYCVVSPLSIESCCYWGRGTKWSLSSEENNTFRMCNSNPVVIALLPDGERLFFMVAIS